MNKYFTGEYVGEAVGKEIQGLRPKLDIYDFYVGNYFIHSIKIISPADSSDYYKARKDLTWLPTGDQLDEEIINICDEKNYNYKCYRQYKQWITVIDFFDNSCREIITKFSANSYNPLIAKIRLLKELTK